MKCKYCGWEFIPSPRHESEKVLPYCSLGCRRLATERHVAYEEKRVELTETIALEALEAQTRLASSTESLVDLPEEAQDKLLSFIWVFARLTSVQRDVLCQRLCGLNGEEIGRLRGCSKQAVHKALVDAAAKSVAVRNYLGREIRTDKTNPQQAEMF